MHDMYSFNARLGSCLFRSNHTGAWFSCTEVAEDRNGRLFEYGGGDSVTSDMFGEVFPWTPQASLLSSGIHHSDSKSKSDAL